MRKLLLTMLGLGLMTFAMAQSSVSKKEVQKATDELVALYRLDNTQAAQVYEIQERRLINLQEIEKVKTSDYALYLRKCRAVRIATENALKKLFTEPQMAIYQAQVAERRQRESAKMKDLKRQGVNKEEIELGLLEIE